MVKYLLGVLTGIILVMMLAVLIVVMFSSFRSAEPGIDSDSVLTLDLSGDVPEHVWMDFSLDFLQGVPSTMLELHDTFRKAAADNRVRAVALQLRGLEIGWARAQEIRSSIEEFKKSKKPVLALLSRGDSLDYYVASAADEIYLVPEALLDVKGFRAEVSFYKDTLSKIGVEAQMEHVGKYKSAVEPYSRTEMSDAFREVTNSILDEMYTEFLRATGEARGKTADQMRAAIDSGPFIAQGALDAGLVDGLLYEDQFEDKLKEKLGVQEVHDLDQKQYRKVSLDSLGLGGDHKVAVVYAVGAIMQGDGESDPLFGSQVISAESFNKTLKKVREDDSVEGVILRVDSPGGDAFASDQIWREVQLLDEAKPMVISMSDVAASGGYYLSMAKSPIIAYPATYTGSIGVFFGKLNLRGLYDKIGVKKDIIKRGRFADIYTDYRDMTDEEHAKLREGIEATYKTFVQKVADARGKSWDEINEIAQGRVWLGSQAAPNGLIDELGGFDKAIEMVKKEAGLKDDAKVRLVTYPMPKRLLDVIFDRDTMAKQPAWMRTLLHEHFGDVTTLPVLLEGGMMRLVPYTINVQ